MRRNHGTVVGSLLKMQENKTTNSRSGKKFKNSTEVKKNKIPTVLRDQGG